MYNRFNSDPPSNYPGQHQPINSIFQKKNTTNYRGTGGTLAD